jgi:hypothetical protein
LYGSILLNQNTKNTWKQKMPPVPAATRTAAAQIVAADPIAPGPAAAADAIAASNMQKLPLNAGAFYF